MPVVLGSQHAGFGPAPESPPAAGNLSPADVVAEGP